MDSDLDQDWGHPPPPLVVLFLRLPEDYYKITIDIFIIIESQGVSVGGGGVPKVVVKGG